MKLWAPFGYRFGRYEIGDFRIEHMPMPSVTSCTYPIADNLELWIDTSGVRFRLIDMYSNGVIALGGEARQFMCGETGPVRAARQIDP